MHEGVARLLGAAIDGLVYSDAAETNVFLDRAPSSQDSAVIVYSQASTEADSKLPYDPAEFQIVVRSADPAWALAMWRKIRSRLHGKRNFTLPDGTYVVYVLATQSTPLPLGEDENGRAQFSGDYRAEIMTITEERQ